MKRLLVVLTGICVLMSVGIVPAASANPITLPPGQYVVFVGDVPTWVVEDWGVSTTSHGTFRGGGSLDGVKTCDWTIGVAGAEPPPTVTAVGKDMGPSVAKLLAPNNYFAYSNCKGWTSDHSTPPDSGGTGSAGIDVIKSIINWIIGR